MEIINILQNNFKNNIIKVCEESNRLQQPNYLFIEEAAIRSVLSNSINEYLLEKNYEYSFVISESIIKRKLFRGRIDIFSKINNEIYFIEVKGGAFGSSNFKSDINNAINGLKKANEQLKSIDYNYNSSWYFSKNNQYRYYGVSIVFLIPVIRNNDQNLDEKIKLAELSLPDLSNNKFNKFFCIFKISVVSQVFSNAINSYAGIPFLLLLAPRYTFYTRSI